DRQLFEFAQQFLLAFSQRDRRFDHDVAEQVACIARTHALDALAAQTEGLAGLRTLRQREGSLAVERGHFDLATERRLGKGNRNLAMQVVAFALEYRMLLDADFHVEVARRTAIHAGFAIAGRADAHAVVNAGRDLHFERFVALDLACAAASRARRWIHLAGALAFRAGLQHAEETLLHAHLAMAAAGGTGSRRSAGLGTTAVAGVALVPRRYADRGVVAVR